MEFHCCKVSDGIDGNKIVTYCDGVSLIPIEAYNQNIKYGSLFDIELNKCYFSQDLSMNNWNLDYGHHIHLKCAYEMYRRNKQQI